VAFLPRELPVVMHEKWTLKSNMSKSWIIVRLFCHRIIESIPGSGEIVANGTTCHPVVVQQK
jgi:hypothetical protein